MDCAVCSLCAILVSVHFFPATDNVYSTNKSILNSLYPFSRICFRPSITLYRMGKEPAREQTKNHCLPNAI